MKNSIIPITAASAICAAALVGCEWGGVHSGESWNDAYSWANFTGTYKLVTAVAAEDSGGETVTEASDSVTTTYNGNGSYSTGKAGLVPGSVTVTIASVGSFTDNGDKTTTFSGSAGHTVTIDYSAGNISINLAANVAPYIGKTVTIGFKYNIAEAAAAAVNESPITWLNLTQKGNLLTFQDNTGMVYSGKITGASCPNADNEGYITAAHIRFTFEATSTSNSKIKLSGTLSGDWSGGSSKTSGTLSNRTIDASYTRGRGATQFMAVSGSVTIYATGVSSGI